MIKFSETVAAIILGEGTRDNHEGFTKEFSDITSIKTDKEIKKEAKNISKEVQKIYDDYNKEEFGK